MSWDLCSFLQGPTEPCRRDSATTPDGVVCRPGPGEKEERAPYIYSPGDRPCGVQNPKLENHPVDSTGGTPSRPASTLGTPTPFARTPSQHPTETPRLGKKAPRAGRTPPPHSCPSLSDSVRPPPSAAPLGSPAALIASWRLHRRMFVGITRCFPSRSLSDGRQTAFFQQSTTWCRQYNHLHHHHYLVAPLLPHDAPLAE